MSIVNLHTSETAYVAEYYPNQNFPNPIRLFVGRFAGAGDIYRSLLKFDLSKMPQKVTVKSATLRLYVGRKDIPGPQLLNVYPNLNDFDENEVTWNNQPNLGASVGTHSVLDAELNTYISVDITSLVTAWLNGTIPNTGITLEGVEASNALIGFQGVDDNDYTVWPYLVVDYVTGIITIYPAEVLSFLAAGSQTTSSIELGPKTEVSFSIKLSGVGAANAIIQLSNDGVNWTDESGTLIAIVANGEAVLTTNAVAQFARLRVDGLGVVTATVVPSTREL
ncbi:DNRLRE domain-containing protein [uncultured Clostridium sp.]|uniref:DNRLRE domain-containing protein n=1 Tax=uncultured Clostridium sp. TaxID=59620 RepID=UPI0028F0C4D6|nr:DNRLRE domain-containing protein [uncultured Clostridium sp.]